MAKLVLKDCSVLVNGTDLSKWADQVTIDDKADQVEVSGFQEAYKEYGMGQKDAAITVEFVSDFAAAAVDATLYPLYNAGNPFAIEIKPTSNPGSATNPRFYMTVLMYDYSPISGNLNTASKTSVEFKCADQAGLKRLTT